MRFVIAEVLFALGAGLLLHKRWAFFGYFTLTGLITIGSFAELLLVLRPSRAHFNSTVSILAGLLVAAVVPALLLWKRRGYFDGMSAGMNERPPNRPVKSAP